MKKRKTPVGLVIGLVVVGTVIFGMNVMGHRTPDKPKPAADTTALQDTTPDDLKSQVKQQLHSRPGSPMKLPGGHAVAGGTMRNPQDSMLMKPPPMSLAQKVQKPKQDYSGQVVSGWYDNNSGVPKASN